MMQNRPGGRRSSTATAPPELWAGGLRAGGLWAGERWLARPEAQVRGNSAVRFSSVPARL